MTNDNNEDDEDEDDNNNNNNATAAKDAKDEDSRLKACMRLEPKEQSSQLISSRNRAALKLTTTIVVVLWALFHLDSVRCFHHHHQQQQQNKPGHGLNTMPLPEGHHHHNHDQTTGQLVLGLGLMESNANVTNTAGPAARSEQLSGALSDGRWSFGQRLLALGNGATSLAALNSSLLARTLRHLNGKLKPFSGSGAGLVGDSESVMPEAAGNHVDPATNKSTKKDYETTQISENSQDSVWLKGPDAGSPAVASSSSSSKVTGLARPNLSLDTWARLINMRNINTNTTAFSSSQPVSSSIEISAGRKQQLLLTSQQLASQSNQTTTASERPKTSFNFAHGNTRHGGNMPLPPTQALNESHQDNRGPSLLSVATGSGLISLPPLPASDSAQETLSIGIMLKPSPPNNRTSIVVSDKDTETTAASTSTKHNGEASFSSPDWQASTDIEQVIYTGSGGSGSSVADAKQELSGKQEATKQAHKEEANDGERFKGHDESGYWSKEKHGAEGEQGQAKKGTSDGDQRLVDMGHNKHGWKNVYHKEEYAQHHKYHDVFHDKDWHDKKGKYNESHQYNRGNKFNESLSKSYSDKDKVGSKYVYRKGNDWKRSEEEQAVDHDDIGQLSAASAADEAADNENDQLPLQQIRALAHQHNHGKGGDGGAVAGEGDEDQDHQKVGSNNRKSVAAGVGGDSGQRDHQENELTGFSGHRADRNFGDNLDDDLVLEQMKARLESMSEQYGDGGSNQLKSRQAASNGVYQLQRPPSSVTSGQYQSNNNTHESITRNQNTSEGAGVDEPTSKRANSDTREPNHKLRDGSSKRLKQQASTFASWNRGHPDAGNGTRYNMSTGGGANEARTDDDDDDGGGGDNDDDDAGGVGGGGDAPHGRPANMAVRDQLAQDKPPNKTIVRGEDKRNGLRLKLELDLGKSSAVNQIPAASEEQGNSQQQRRQNGSYSLTKTFTLGTGAGSGANSTPVAQHTKQFTNSLGHSIGSNTHKGGPPAGGWQANSNTTTAKTRPSPPLELASPLVKQARDSTNSWTRSPSKEETRDDARAHTSASPTARNPSSVNKWPRRQRQDSASGGAGNNSARLTTSAQTRPPAAMPAPNNKTPLTTRHNQRPQSPIYVRHLEMNGGGIVLGKLDDFQPSQNHNRSSAAQLAPAFSHQYDDSQSGHGLSLMDADDLTVETSLPSDTNAEHLFQSYHDHELTLAGAHRPALSVLEHEEETQAPREFMVVFGGGGDGGGGGGPSGSDYQDDSHDDAKLQRHVIAQASDNHYSRHHSAHQLRLVPPMMMQEQLTGDYQLNGLPNVKGEPGVIFEASASTIHDDLRPASTIADHYGTGQLASQHPRHALPMSNFDSLRHENHHHHQLNQPHHRQQHRHNQQQQLQETMLNDYLNYDYSTAHLSYANAPRPPPVAQQIDDESGENHHHLYMLNANGDNRLVSGAQLPPANQLVEPQTGPGGNRGFWDNALNSVPNGQTAKSSAITNLKQQPGAQQFVASGATSKPMIAALRDHMNSLPLSLLRAASSSVNYALLTSQQPAATAVQVPLVMMMQQQSPSSSVGGGSIQSGSGTNSLVAPLVGSAASVIPFGRWLRLPRVIENQFQQQRSKRYNKLLLANEQQQQAIAPGTMAKMPIRAQLSIGAGQQWSAAATGQLISNSNNNRPRPFYQSHADSAERGYELQPLMTSSLVDPMQAEYSAHKVSHALAAAPVINGTLPPSGLAVIRSRPANLTSNTNNHRQPGSKSLRTFATHSSHYHGLTGGGGVNDERHSRNPFRQASSAAVKPSSLTKHYQHQVGKLSGTRQGNNNNGNDSKPKQTNLMKTDYNNYNKKRDHLTINYDKMPTIVPADDRPKSGDNKREYAVHRPMRIKKSNNYHNSNRQTEYRGDRTQLRTADGDGDALVVAAASTLKPQRVAPMMSHMHIHRHHQHQIDHRQQSAGSGGGIRQAQRPQLSRPLILNGHQGLNHNHRDHREQLLGQSQLLFPMVGPINPNNNNKRFLAGLKQQQQQLGRARTGPAPPPRLIANNNSNKLIESQAKIGASSKYIVKSSISSFGQRVLDNLKFSTKSI